MSPLLAVVHEASPLVVATAFPLAQAHLCLDCDRLFQLSREYHNLRPAPLCPGCGSRSHVPLVPWIGKKEAA